jgi:serine/threonine-protein kinase
VGRYAIYEEIAAGGMASVHYGRLVGPIGFSRTVAIKRLHPQYAKDPEFVTMFLDEARLASRIRHPNVVQTLDVVTSEDEVFLVMDYVHGESLARVMRGGEKIPLQIALRIASDTLQGLHAAHEARDELGLPLNLVHRDISPHNILLGADGIARVVDFGVAKATGRAATTQQGHIKGKLGYMAPEQLGGVGTVTRRSDIHAFSVVLWEMLAGRRLFAGDNEARAVEVVVKHVVPPLSLRGLPRGLDDVVQRGLAVDPENRYATAREMAQALEDCGAMSANLTVGDWVQVKVKDSLAKRASVVQAMEADSGRVLPPASGAAEGRPMSAHDWVKRLSSAEIDVRPPPSIPHVEGNTPILGGARPSMPGEPPVASSAVGTAPAAPPPAGARAEAPPPAPAREPAPRDGALDNPHDHVALESLPPAAIPGLEPRSPVLKIAVAAACLALAIVVWRTAGRSPETASTTPTAATSGANAAAPTSPAIASAPPVPVSPPAPAPQAPAAATDPSAAASATAVASTSPPPAPSAETAPAPPSPTPPAATPRARSTTQHSPRKPHPDSVFGSRE